MSSDSQSFKLGLVQFSVPIKWNQHGVASQLQGDQVKQCVKTFSDGTDMEFLETMDDINEMVEAKRENGPSCYGIAEAILRGDALKHFKEIATQENRTHQTLLNDLAALGQKEYFDEDTQRSDIIDEMEKMRKTRETTVKQTASRLKKLNRLIHFLPDGQDDPLPESDLLRHLKNAMPQDWQK